MKQLSTNCYRQPLWMAGLNGIKHQTDDQKNAPILLVKNRMEILFKFLLLFLFLWKITLWAIFKYYTFTKGSLEWCKMNERQQHQLASRFWPTQMSNGRKLISKVTSLFREFGAFFRQHSVIENGHSLAAVVPELCLLACYVYHVYTLKISWIMSIQQSTKIHFTSECRRIRTISRLFISSIHGCAATGCMKRNTTMATE